MPVFFVYCGHFISESKKMERSILTVSQLNNYISAVFSFDTVLTNVEIKGEISNFKKHSSGHLYFSLKDESSRIACVMFRSDAKNLSFNPIDGANVLLKGRVGVYEKNGQYQVYVGSMREDGIGTLYEQYNRLIELLREKGYFDDSLKKPLPYLPKRIALVTSPSGAAVRDMISVILRRFPYAQIIVCPVLVQGEGASRDIASMINYINEKLAADVIITGRGGGSIEELWAFNERSVAEAIYKSRIPVISAVGHETDFTISDFVADKRAATPSAAAELCVPDIRELKTTLIKYRQSLVDMITRIVRHKGRDLEVIENNRVFASPFERFNMVIMELDFYKEKLVNSIKTKLSLIDSKLESMGRLLISYSYENALKRGYCVISENGEIIHSDTISRQKDVEIITASKIADVSINKITMREFGSGK